MNINCGSNHSHPLFRKGAILVLFSLLLVQNAGIVYAQDSGKEILFDAGAVQKSYTGKLLDKLNFSFATSTFSKKTGISAVVIDENLDMPWKYKRVSEIFQYEIGDKTALRATSTFKFDIYYDKKDANYKRAFFYDKNQKSWRELPSQDFSKYGFVRVQINFPFARIAVFSDPEIPLSGKASWYGSKKGAFAASPDFPYGSRLRVYNIANGKFIDVDVADYGPDRKLHPDRVVDLSRDAFARIADLKTGIVSVRAEVLKIGKAKTSDASPSSSANGIKKTFDTKIPSVALINASNGNIIYSKNATTSMPLASLSKMAAAKVFMDTKPDLEKIVEYKKQDEKYNHAYVDFEWQSAKLKVKEGETMKVKDLLYSALVGSANNAVESLVRVSGLKREDFIKKMNEFVAGIGADSTHFVEPTGLSPQNFSSALDYAIISQEVLKNPIIKKVSSARQYIFSTANTKEKHTINNTNHLIRDGKYNITGSKTGYLDEAGYCLMTSAENKGKKIIAVTFGAPTRALSFADTAELLNYGFRNY